jgi:hypothetical protein
MSPRPSATWVSAGRVIRRFRFPLLLLVVGLALNIVVYTGDLTTSERRAAEELSADAGALSSLIKEAVQHGLTQISAVDGLFQASEEVTAAEFEDFAHIIGGEPVSLLGFAWMVPAEGVEAYLTETRNTWPDFEIFEETAGHRTAVSARNRYIPIHYAVSFSDLPEERGFDLASDPHRLAAIDRTLETYEPTLTTGFVEIEGDVSGGDVELFLAVAGLPGKPTGVTFTVLEIDEVLADRAPDILPQGASWSLTQIAPVSLSDLSAVLTCGGEQSMFSTVSSCSTCTHPRMSFNRNGRAVALASCWVLSRLCWPPSRFISLSSSCAHVKRWFASAISPSRRTGSWRGLAMN